MGLKFKKVLGCVETVNTREYRELRQLTSSSCLALKIPSEFPKPGRTGARTRLEVRTAVVSFVHYLALKNPSAFLKNGSTGTCRNNGWQKAQLRGFIYKH